MPLTGYRGGPTGVCAAPLLRTVSPLDVVRSSRAAAWCAVSGAGVRSLFCALTGQSSYSVTKNSREWCIVSADGGKEY
jgi:hypothetical protein